MRILGMVFFLLTVLPAGCAFCQSNGHGQPVSICGNGLSCEDAKGMEVRALDGDGEAAIELFWDASDNDRKDDALFWAQIAMENGNSAGRHNYAVLLMEKGDLRSLMRARFHLKILVAQGDKDSGVLLSDVEKKLRGQ